MGRWMSEDDARRPTRPDDGLGDGDPGYKLRPRSSKGNAIAVAGLLGMMAAGFLVAHHAGLAQRRPA